MDIILSVLYFVVVLGILVFIHELGHLIAAKTFGVYCKEFAIGMGPKVYSIKKDHWETTYSIRLLPLGGFVSMAGEPGEGDMDVPFERTVPGIARWKRLIVMLAGVTMNIALAYLIFFGMTLHYGAVDSPKPIIQEVIKDSPAEAAGMLAYDEIIELTFYDGTSMRPKNFDLLTQAISTYGKKSIDFTVLRDGNEVTLSITPEKIDDGRYIIGVYPVRGELRQVAFFEAINIAHQQVLTIITALVFLIPRLFRGIGTEAVGGPIEIFRATSEIAVYGLPYFFLLLANLSVNLAVLNLLPIPVLDGGRALLTVFEMIIRRPIPEKIENFVMLIGVLLMGFIFVFIMSKDIIKLFN